MVNLYSRSAAQKACAAAEGALAWTRAASEAGRKEYDKLGEQEQLDEDREGWFDYARFLEAAEESLHGAVSLLNCASEIAESKPEQDFGGAAAAAPCDAELAALRTRYRHVREKYARLLRLQPSAGESDCWSVQVGEMRAAREYIDALERRLFCAESGAEGGAGGGANG